MKRGGFRNCYYMKNNRFFYLLNQWVNYTALASLMVGVMEWLLPARCPLTGDPVERQGMIAPAAWAALRFVAPPQCPACGVPLALAGQPADETHENRDLKCADCLSDPPPFAAARSSLVYDEASRKLILGFKHADQTYAVKTFVPWLVRAGAEFWLRDPLIIPVPLHRWRLLRRRYNQAALLAHGLAREIKQVCIPDLLLRTRATPRQGRLKAGARASNVRRAFAVNPRHAARLQGRDIVLIDDVLTTGATVRECTAVLLKAGAASVSVLTIARAVKN